MEWTTVGDLQSKPEFIDPLKAGKGLEQIRAADKIRKR